MKFRLVLKDPDGVCESANQYINEGLAFLDISKREKDLLRNEREEDLRKQLSRWIRYNEIVVIEFDFEAGTATVLEVK